MSLADPELRKLLNKKFVVTWGNVEGDPTAGASLAHDPKDAAGDCIRGNGEHNIQILTLNKDGEMLGVTAGFLSSKDLLAELRRMHELDKDLRKNTAREQLSDEERRQLVADAHEQMLADFEQRQFQGPLADWEKKRALADHRFAARKALMPYTGFRPTDLVGNATTFFSSSKNGRPTRRIGESPLLPDGSLPKLPLPKTEPNAPKPRSPRTGRRK